MLMGVKQKLWGSGYWQKSSCEYRKSKKKDDRPREMGLQLEGWAFQLLSQCTVFIAYTDLGFLLARAAWYVPMPAFQPHLFPLSGDRGDYKLSTATIQCAMLQLIHPH